MFTEKPAWRLRKILGRNFRFDSPSTSKDLDNWHERVPSDDEGSSDYEISSDEEVSVDEEASSD